MTGRRVDAVTFDFWNTLVGEAGTAFEKARSTAWFRRLAAEGHEVEAERIESALAVAWSEHSDAWHRNEQYGWERAARRALDHIGLPLAEELVEELLEIFLRANETLRPELCDGVADALAALAESGMRLGIICDVGFTPSTTLRDWLGHHGVLEFFDGWSFSDEVGRYKPAPQIFAHALGYLGVPPERAAHVGDLRRTDVAGARAAGWLSVRYRGVYDDGSDLAEADHVIDRHDELVPLLCVVGDRASGGRS